MGCSLKGEAVTVVSSDPDFPAGDARWLNPCRCARSATTRATGCCASCAVAPGRWCWRRAQMVLLSAQGMPVAKIAEVTFTSPDRVRDVLHNFTADGFDSLYPRYAGGRPPKFDLTQRAQIKQLALSRPQDHDLPFSVWSLSKLADFLVAEGVVDDISHEGLRLVLRDEDVSFQAVKTYKASTDPDYDAKTRRVLELYALADGLVEPGPTDPSVVFCMDEFGPLNLQPHPGRQWAPVVRGKGDPAAP